MTRFTMIAMLLFGFVLATASDAMADRRRRATSGRSRFAVSVNRGNGFNNVRSFYGSGYGQPMGGGGGYYGGGYYGGYAYGNYFPIYSVPTYVSGFSSLPIYGYGYNTLPIYGFGYSSVPIYGVGYGGVNIRHGVRSSGFNIEHGGGFSGYNNNYMGGLGGR